MVIIRFGHDYDETCMQMDEVCGCSLGLAAAAAQLASLCRSQSVAPGLVSSSPSVPSLVPCQILAGTAERMKNFACIYLVSVAMVGAGGAGQGRRSWQGMRREALRAWCSCQTCLCAPPLLSASQVDISEVPDFNAMYELYDPCTIMFFFRNKVTAARGGAHLRCCTDHAWLVGWVGGAGPSTVVLRLRSKVSDAWKLTWHACMHASGLACHSPARAHACICSPA